MIALPSDDTRAAATRISIARFPKDRTVLCVAEVAMKMRVTEQHVLDLIEEGKIQAINIGGGGRNFWRIPVELIRSF
jgi:excisionase family DNA binding protein